MSHLTLVQFNPNDYSLAGVLAAENSTSSADSNFISSVLSLYFQWPEHSRAIAYLDSKSTTYVPCRLDYDRDERNPTEIFIDLECPLEDFEGSVLKVRIEIFRACYEFMSEIIDRQPGEERAFLVGRAPERIQVFKQRRMPRVPCKVDDFPDAAWIDGLDGGTANLTILDLSMKSATAVFEQSQPVSTGGLLRLAGETFAAELVRTDGRLVVFQLALHDAAECGRYFDVYRRIAYPSIRPRNAMPDSAYGQLFVESGYIKRYLPNETEESVVSEIDSVWKLTRSGFHRQTVDYCVVDSEEKPIGTSSAVNAFDASGIPHWIWHQYCTLQDPNLIRESGQLYNWRAEYLSARQGGLRISGWFSSKGRWLERIFVKFQKLSKGTTLDAVRILASRFSSSPSRHDDVQVTRSSIGDATRLCVHLRGSLGGFEPRRLNAGHILDGIIACRSEHPVSDAETIGEAIAHEKGEAIELFVTLPHSQEWPHPVTKTMGGDRYMSFDKDALPDFIHSVDHSIAVMRRKHQV